MKKERNKSLGQNPQDVRQEKMLRFESWASERINKAQEKCDAVKQDLDLKQVNRDPDQMLS